MEGETRRGSLPARMRVGSESARRLRGDLGSVARRARPSERGAADRSAAAPRACAARARDLTEACSKATSDSCRCSTVHGGHPRPRSTRCRGATRARGSLRVVNAAAAAFVLAPALALGSFLNVVVARVPARRSLLLPPSSCGVCATEILWRDNVPVVSYLLLRGRCRHCAAPISPLYPAVEVVTAGAGRRVLRCRSAPPPGPRSPPASARCSSSSRSSTLSTG